MKSAAIRLRLAAALTAVVLMLAPSAAQQPQAPLRPLGGIESLKGWFNANQSHVRALFLLSPT